MHRVFCIYGGDLGCIRISDIIWIRVEMNYEHTFLGRTAAVWYEMSCGKKNDMAVLFFLSFFFFLARPTNAVSCYKPFA